MLCKNVKDPSKNGSNQVTVFTIQVNIGSKDPTSKVLQDCASNGNFQMITSIQSDRERIQEYSYANLATSHREITHYAV